MLGEIDKVYPIFALVVVMFARRDMLMGVCHLFVLLYLYFLSLFEKGRSSQVACHVLVVYIIIIIIILIVFSMI